MSEPRRRGAAPVADETVSPATSGTVSRVIAVLQLVAETESGLSPRALADKLGLPISTGHRLLTLLVNEGMVERVGRSEHVPGAKFRRMSQQIAERTSLEDLVRPWLLRVVERTGESCAFGRYDTATGTVEFIAVAESPHPLTYRVPLNQPTPLDLGASGKAILARLPQSVAADIIEASLGQRQLLEQLDHVRSTGWLMTTSEKLNGAVGIAAPVMGAQNRVVGCLCITVPEARFERGREAVLGPEVALSAREASLALGLTAAT